MTFVKTYQTVPMAKMMIVTIMTMLLLSSNVAKAEPCGTDALQYNEALSAGQFLTCGHIKFGLTSDGKLVYDNSYVPPTVIADGQSSNAKLTMQGDGNLVLYSDGKPIWDSKTNGNHGAKLQFGVEGYVNIVAVDGNILATYANQGCMGVQLNVGERLHPGQFLCDKEYQFGLDANGKVFCSLEGNIYLPVNHPGNAGTMVLQSDGNLVAYEDGNPVWSSGSHGYPGSALYLVDAVSPEIYDSTGEVIWGMGCD